MHSQGVERREFQRLHLESPISGTFGNREVSIVEIGILGARIEHPAPLESPRGDLHFTFGGSPIHMRCEIARSTGPVSGLRFLAAIGDSGDNLRDMLGQLVVKALESRHDSSATRLRIRAVDGDKTVRGVDAHFLSYQFEDGAWKRRPVLLPDQPQMGFTVARGEDAVEMQRLCEVFEASDEEGRRLIRLFAELSVTDALQIPPRT
jgi:hypothetical protein